MFNNIAYAMAPAQGGGAQAQNPFAPFIMLILIFGIFYFLLIRPQQKKQKQHMAMLNSVKAGDEIVTTGGIFAKIDKVIDNNTFIVEIDNGVKVKLSRNGIAMKVTAESNVTSEK